MPEVRLRPWRLKDADDVAVMIDDDHLRSWCAMGDGLERWVRQEIAEARGPSRVICLPEDDRALGRVAVRLTGLRSVVLDIEAGNVASERLAQRLGAERRAPARVEMDRSRVARTLVVHVLAVTGA